MGENNSLAQKLLANQAKIASIKQGSRERELTRLRENVQALLLERDAHAAKSKAGQLGGVLAERARRADDESENALEDALSTPTVLDAEALSMFKEQYLDKKIAKHSRLAMKARLEADENKLRG